MNKHLLMATLQGIRFLRGISREHLEQLVAIAQLCDYEDHEIIFRENDDADSVYLVVFGQVCLELCASGVGCRRVLTVGPGEILGRSALVEQSRFTATARAVDTTRLVRIDASQLVALCERDPRFGYEFMRRAMLAQGKRLVAAWNQLLDVYASMLPPAVGAGRRSEY